MNELERKSLFAAAQQHIEQVRTDFRSYISNLHGDEQRDALLKLLPKDQQHDLVSPFRQLDNYLSDLSYNFQLMASDVSDVYNRQEQGQPGYNGDVFGQLRLAQFLNNSNNRKGLVVLQAMEKFAQGKGAEEQENFRNWEASKILQEAVVPDPNFWRFANVFPEPVEGLNNLWSAKIDKLPDGVEGLLKKKIDPFCTSEEALPTLDQFAHALAAGGLGGAALAPQDKVGEFGAKALENDNARKLAVQQQKSAEERKAQFTQVSEGLDRLRSLTDTTQKDLEQRYTENNQHIRREADQFFKLALDTADKLSNDYFVQSDRQDPVDPCMGGDNQMSCMRGLVALYAATALAADPDFSIKGMNGNPFNVYDLLADTSSPFSLDEVLSFIWSQDTCKNWCKSFLDGKAAETVSAVFSGDVKNGALQAPDKLELLGATDEPTIKLDEEVEKALGGEQDEEELQALRDYERMLKEERNAPKQVKVNKQPDLSDENAQNLMKEIMEDERRFAGEPEQEENNNVIRFSGAEEPNKEEENNLDDDLDVFEEDNKSADKKEEKQEPEEKPEEKSEEKSEKKPEKTPEEELREQYSREADDTYRMITLLRAQQKKNPVFATAGGKFLVERAMRGLKNVRSYFAEQAKAEKPEGLEEQSAKVHEVFFNLETMPALFGVLMLVDGESVKVKGQELRDALLNNTIAPEALPAAIYEDSLCRDWCKDSMKPSALVSMVENTLALSSWQDLVVEEPMEEIENEIESKLDIKNENDVKLDIKNENEIKGEIKGEIKNENEIKGEIKNEEESEIEIKEKPKEEIKELVTEPILEEEPKRETTVVKPIIEQVIDVRAGLEEMQRLYKRMNGTIHFWQHNSKPFKDMMAELKKLDEFVKAQGEGAILMTKDEFAKKYSPVLQHARDYQIAHANLKKLGGSQTERLKCIGRMAQTVNATLNARNVKTSVEAKREALALKLAQAEAVRQGGLAGTKKLCGVGLNERSDALSVSPVFIRMLEGKSVAELDTLLKTNGQKLLTAFDKLAAKLPQEPAKERKSVKKDDLGPVAKV